MSKPKISVIIPVYNVEKYLGECLDSIVNQTLKDIEVICINDGSKDNSLSILKDYASKDDRIKIIDKENEGQGYARKVGLDIASGEYILFCDSDDKYYSNDVFDELYNEIKNNNSELMFFRFWFGDRESVKLEFNINLKDNSQYIFYLYFAPWFKIYKKSFLDRYDSWCFPKYLKFQDMPFHIQSCLRTDSISYFDKICYFYRDNNPTNVTNSKVGRKHIQNICEIILLVYDILKEEKCLDKYHLEFAFLAINRLKYYFVNSGERTDLIPIIKDTLKKIYYIIDSAIKTYSLNNIYKFPYLDKEHILFYKSFSKLDNERLCKYIEGKKQKRFNILQKKIEYYENFCMINSKNIKISSNELTNQIVIKDQIIKSLQNSWSYRIGRAITYPLSIPLGFYRFIRDYNLIKKSGLFDSEYYLANNEDVKKAKVDPIKHYLKFGWKEGRNPSGEFDGNKYLNKRPDVRVAGICPLVHYIKFGRNNK